jgi:hypothetical protein
MEYALVPVSSKVPQLAKVSVAPKMVRQRQGFGRVKSDAL